MKILGRDKLQNYFAYLAIMCVYVYYANITTGYIHKNVYLPLHFLRYRVFIKYCGFSKILRYIPDSGLSQFSFGVTMAGQTTALQQQNLQSSEKSQHFEEKHNI